MNQLQIKIYDFLKEMPEITVAFLFGSQITGNISPHSDIDIALLFKENFRPSPDYLLQIQDGLVSKLKGNVDIVNLNQASPIIKMQVLRKGEKILEKDHKAYLHFFVRTINEYDDLKKVRSVNEKNILRGRIYG